MGDPVKVITARVERLIARVPAPGRVRRWVEVGLASAVLTVGASAAVTVPRWIATDLNADSLSFVYLTGAPVVPAESPAFATFRALTPPAASDAAGRAAVGANLPAPPVQRGCPCVESQAQLLRGEVAHGNAGAHRLAWGSSNRAPWDVSEPYEDVAVRTARPLVLLGDSGPHVGFFVVGRPGH